MKRFSAWRSLCLRGLVGVSLGIAVSGAAWSQETLPPGKAKEVIESVCTQCHGLSNITNNRFSKADWQAVVEQMIANGASLSDSEKEMVVEYLALNFPDKKTAESAKSDKVNVNKATAKELVASLGLSEKEAEAVVQYRQKNGNFAKWEDLQKVPDLDSKKIEAKKDQITF